jgi:glycosyltransferase involved in cell wall biosynthesis
MSSSPPARRDEVVINATALGRSPDGISAVARHLVTALVSADSRFRFLVVMTTAAPTLLPALNTQAHVRVRWVSDRIAPHRGTSGHARRWWFANQLAWRHRQQGVFGLSQIEAPLVGRPGIILIHDVIPLQSPAYHPRQRHYFAHLLGRAARRAAFVAVPSEATRAAVIDALGVDADRVCVIPHGPTVPIADTISARRRPATVLYLGRPKAAKNLGVLIEAVGRMAPAHDVRLIVAGGGELDVPVPASLATRVEIVGEVTEARKLSLLDEATMLVSPSPHEGFGLPALEALARGCPVIAAEGGSLAEVCHDAALYVDTGNADALASTIGRVLADETLGPALSARGLARARDFSWTRAANGYLELFERASDPHREK